MPDCNHLSFFGCLFIASRLMTPLHASIYTEDFLFNEKPTRDTFELVKEFFNRSLLPSCDFTVGVCDINCCQDQDCKDENVEAYNCHKEESSNQDPLFSDPSFCYSDSFKFVDPILCYELENTPYLGTYFEEEVVGTRVELLLDKVSTVNHKYSFREPAQSLNARSLGQFLPYKYGDSVLNWEEGNPVHFPQSIIGRGCCEYESDIRFLVDTRAVCSSHINANKCEENEKLSLKYYFEENELGQLFLPLIFNGNINSTAEVKVTVLCGHHLFEISDLSLTTDDLSECENIFDVKESKYDEFQHLCENVVTRIDYIFYWRENYVDLVNLTVTLSDVSLRKRQSIVPSRKRADPQLAQTFNVIFVGNTEHQGPYRGDYGIFDKILLNHVS